LKLVGRTGKEEIMMTRLTFEEELRAHLRRQPFRPFVIEFDDGLQWVVERPEVVSYYTGDSALYFHPDGSFDFVDCDAVRRMVEVTPATST
jgi:hypothetical protein